MNFLGGFPPDPISLWPKVFLDISLLATLVTCHIWPGKLPFSRATTISTVTAIEINLIKSLVDQLLNGHIVCLWKRRLVLRLFFASSRLPPLWIHKIAVCMRTLLYKGHICYELLLWYDTHITNKKFLDKFRNLLVLLNIPQTESVVRSILKYASDLP